MTKEVLCQKQLTKIQKNRRDSAPLSFLLVVCSRVAQEKSRVEKSSKPRNAENRPQKKSKSKSGSSSEDDSSDSDSSSESDSESSSSSSSEESGSSSSSSDNDKPRR